jgi:hypothetical protein
MDYRGVLLAVGALSAAALAMATACSAPDPGQITFSDRQHQAGDGTSGGTPGSSSGTDSGSGGTSGTSGSTGTDGGSSGAPDPFFGTDAFQTGQPGSVDSTVGAGHMGATAPGATGVDCANCHKTGGASANIWTAAGTVYTARVGGNPVGEGVEVRINDANGKKLASAYTDKAGNFAFNNAALATLPATAHVGVRNATTKGVMVANPTGGCNAGGTCHGQGTAQGRISVTGL